MTTFVLVHGAWVGEWCYDPIIPLLEAKGHTALAVSLTGFGKKRHLYSPDTNILDHIQDVVDFVESRDLSGFTLVGHSYGGGVITGAWDLLRDRISDLFYLDASTPLDGDSHYDQMVRYDQRGQLEVALEKAIASGKKERPFPIAALRKRDPEKAAYMQDKVMPFPLGCMTTPVHFKNGSLPTATPKTFVLCKKNISYHHQQAEAIRADKSWCYFELDTYHDCMWEDPEGLVEILTR
ncbi:MAG: alpha/beta hydrolase family protein [Chloroflexota bacterium]